MRHLTEEELILHYYGDADEGTVIEEHLRSCESCREEHEALQAVLASVSALPAPEKHPAYGSAVWHRIRPRLQQRRWYFRWTPVAAIAALVLLAVLAGRFRPRPPEPPVISEQVRDRILLSDVGEHLDRAQVVLVELANSPVYDAVDVSAEQERAEDLLGANRLYRQTAAGAGEAAVASLLEDLERTLLEIAHSSSRPEAGALDEILFKVRATGLQLRVREQQTDRDTRHGRS